MKGVSDNSRASYYRKNLPRPLFSSLSSSFPPSIDLPCPFSHSPPPFVDSGFSCYSNRAASPASEPHWRHVHCRIHLRLSWRLPRESPVPEGGTQSFCWSLSPHTHRQFLPPPVTPTLSQPG